MKTSLFVAVSVVALVSLSTPALSQPMPGMAMPSTAKKEPAKKLDAKKKPRSRTGRAGKRIHSKAAPMKRGRQQAHSVSKDMPMPMPIPDSGMSRRPAGPQGQSGPITKPANSSQMPQGMAMPSMRESGGTMSMPVEHGAHAMSSVGAYGPYPDQRESSGTAWQPDATIAMSGPMLMSGDWMLMAHGTLNLVDDHQSGTRGADKAFASGMLMGMARHPLGNGTVQFRAMLSPDPIMGPSGYPLLLASGETANGQTPLVDRQHPHDLFMELSASVSHNIGPKSSLFLYAGLPGEPAFGPPAFMHRESILDSPEAPITHHWLDSTHITFGVVTAGLVLDRFKIEASQFNAREPDQHRWNIETGPLDSTSVRLSWNPTRTLALQGSWGHFKDPEQLEPGVNQTRWSASALWADDVAPGWHVAVTLAWGRKSSQGHNDDGLAAEASIKHQGWTLFGRGEWIENRELLGLVDSPAYKVGKISLGGVHDFRIAEHLSVGAGALVSANFVPDALAPLYGGHRPLGAMGFVRLKLN